LAEVTKMWLETKRLQITKQTLENQKIAILPNVLKIYIYIYKNYEEERFGFFREFWKWFCFWG